MFERFTDGARRVLVLAQEEGRLLRHGCVAPEHLLIGLIGEGDGIASQALRALDISVLRARETLVQMVGQGEVEVAGSLPFTNEARQLLELSLLEALQTGCNYIGTEHLLLALVRQEAGTAMEVLEILGADRAAVRQEVQRLLAGDPPPAVRAEDAREVETPPDPAELLTPEDVDEVWHEHGYGSSVERGERLVDGVRYVWSSYPSLTPPTPRLAVAAAEVSIGAFDRYTAELGPDQADPVHGLGERATFDRRRQALRVLSGSTLFVLTLSGAWASLDLATALARKVVARLEA